MGNFQIGYSFVDYTPTASTEATGYADDNIKLYSKGERSWRSTVVTETAIVLDFGSAKAIVALLLHYCNFASVTIQGNATNVWTSPSYSQAFTITNDATANLYKLWAALSAFNYRYLRIKIPAQTPTDGAAYFKIATVVAMNTVLTLTENPDAPYEFSCDEAVEMTEFPGGGVEINSLGRCLWSGVIRFDRRTSTQRSDFDTINTMAKGTPVALYENNSDTDKCWVVQRIGPVSFSEDELGYMSIAGIPFKEVE